MILMLSDYDIMRAAYLVITRHGDHAVAAAQRRRHDLAECEPRAAETWQRIAVAIAAVGT